MRFSVLELPFESILSHPLKLFTPLEINARLLCPVHHAVQGSAAGLDFRIIPAGFNAPLEFLTGFTDVKLRI